MSSSSKTAKRRKAAKKRLLAKQEERVQKLEQLAKSLKRPRNDKRNENA